MEAAQIAFTVAGTGLIAGLFLGYHFVDNARRRQRAQKAEMTEMRILRHQNALGIKEMKAAEQVLRQQKELEVAQTVRELTAGVKCKACGNVFSENVTNEDGKKLIDWVTTSNGNPVRLCLDCQKIGGIAEADRVNRAAEGEDKPGPSDSQCFRSDGWGTE